jgi:hypothetical protein
VPRGGVLEAVPTVAAAIHVPAQDTSYTLPEDVCPSSVDVPRTARKANVLHYNPRVNTMSSLFERALSRADISTMAIYAHLSSAGQREQVDKLLAGPRMSRPVAIEARAARLEAIERLLARLARERLPLPRNAITPAGRRELREYDRRLLGGPTCWHSDVARARPRRATGPLAPARSGLLVSRRGRARSTWAVREPCHALPCCRAGA